MPFIGETEWSKFNKSTEGWIISARKDKRCFRLFASLPALTAYAEANSAGVDDLLLESCQPNVKFAPLYWGEEEMSYLHLL